jgi:hypothetical protein
MMVVLTTVPAAGQGRSFVTFGEQRPFVIGFIPVVSGGAVGGVSIDARGVVSRSQVEDAHKLRDARLQALARLDSRVAAVSSLRKVSLRRLQAAIERLRRQGQPMPGEMQHLAGLQRIEFVFVYPQERDIVLAGPAEGCKVDAAGNVVGQTSGQSVMQLDDLIVALRTAENAATGHGITCSIDPTEEGLARFQRLLKSRTLEMNEATIARLESAVGPQQVTLTGISPASHFAHVLVAADFLMKRLSMDFEPAPVEGLPSYLEMLRDASASPRGSMPRFWMAPNYEALGRDVDGLAWRLGGRGVKTLSEDGYLAGGGAVASGRREDALAKKWADAMTARFDELARALPAFGQLRNCMDLAVVAALIAKEDLATAAGCDLSLLLDDKRIKVAEYQVPRTIESRATFVRKGRDWIVGISGGVDVNSWSVLEDVKVQPELAKTRAIAAPAADERWWWD